MGTSCSSAYQLVGDMRKSRGLRDKEISDPGMAPEQREPPIGSKWAEAQRGPGAEAGLSGFPCQFLDARGPLGPSQVACERPGGVQPTLKELYTPLLTKYLPT